MPQASFHALLSEAEKHGFALPAFNTNNLEFTQAIIAAAEQNKSPIILAVSEGAWKYAGQNSITQLALSEARRARVPVCVHFDHGQSHEHVAAALAAGYDSVMFDGSTLPFEENVARSKEIARLARARKAGVELELGHVGRKGEKEAARTDPSQAKKFVALTRPDALAVAVGTSHAWTRKQERVDFKLLEELHEAVNIPLVLHGSSGVADRDLRSAISSGVRKVNIDTQLKSAFSQACARFLKRHVEVVDPREFLKLAREDVRKTAAGRIKACGASNKARLLSFA